jgi:hypothetical protein
MSKSAVELGTFPPRGTTITLQLLPLRVPQAEGPPLIMWNVTGRYPHAEGSAICFSVTADEPIGLAHIAAGLCKQFELPLAQAIPPAPADLAAVGLPGVPMLTVLAYNQGTFRQPAQDVTPDLTEFMARVQTFIDVQSRVAAQGVMVGAARTQDAAAKASLLDALPESLKVGPHPKTGDYAPACGARLTATGPVLAEPCVSGGPCSLTSSGRCYRWKGTEAASASVAVPLAVETPVAAPSVVLVAEAPTAETAPSTDAPILGAPIVMPAEDEAAPEATTPPEATPEVPAAEAEATPEAAAAAVDVDTPLVAVEVPVEAETPPAPKKTSAKTSGKKAPRKRTAPKKAAAPAASAK